MPGAPDTPYGPFRYPPPTLLTRGRISTPGSTHLSAPERPQPIRHGLKRSDRNCQTTPRRISSSSASGSTGTSWSRLVIVGSNRLGLDVEPKGCERERLGRVTRGVVILDRPEVRVDEPSLLCARPVLHDLGVAEPPEASLVRDLAFGRQIDVVEPKRAGTWVAFGAPEPCVRPPSPHGSEPNACVAGLVNRQAERLLAARDRKKAGCPPPDAVATGTPPAEAGAVKGDTDPCPRSG